MLTRKNFLELVTGLVIAVVAGATGVFASVSSRPWHHWKSMGFTGWKPFYDQPHLSASWYGERSDGQTFLSSAYVDEHATRWEKWVAKNKARRKMECFLIPCGCDLGHACGGDPCWRKASESSSSGSPVWGRPSA